MILHIVGFPFLLLRRASLGCAAEEIEIVLFPVQASPTPLSLMALLKVKERWCIRPFESPSLLGRPSGCQTTVNRVNFV